MGGMVLETSIAEILKAIRDMSRLEKQTQKAHAEIFEERNTQTAAREERPSRRRKSSSKKSGSMQRRRR